MITFEVEKPKVDYDDLLNTKARIQFGRKTNIIVPLDDIFNPD
jgi:hypothetical protein